MNSGLFGHVGEFKLKNVIRWIREPKTTWQMGLSLSFWHLLPLLPFVVIKRLLDHTALLSSDAYANPVIFLEWFRETDFFIVLGLIGLLISLGFRTPLLAGWSGWQDGHLVRIPVGATAVLLAWWFGTLSINLYFGELHLVDRLLLFGLAGLVWWRPVFVIPFLLVLFPYNAQYHYPFGNHSVAQISLPSNLLLLFVAVYVVQLVSGRKMTRSFFFLVFCLIAASYVVPGVGKLQLGWVAHRHVFLMIFSSYSVGWLGFLAPASIETIGRWMAFFDWPVVIMTVLIECGALMLLLRRRMAMVWLALFVSLNTMILLTSGIFFWTWIAINGTMVMLLWRFGDRPAFDVFSNGQFALSLPIILLGGWLFNPVKLAWLDAPINYTYHLEATTAAGEQVAIPTAALAPHDTHFALGNFGFLSEEPQLGIVWGAVHDLTLARELAAAETAEAVWQIEERSGHVAFDRESAAQFDELIRRAAGRWNDDSSRPLFRLSLGPRQVWTFQPEAVDPVHLSSPIEQITIYQTVTFFNGQKYEIIRRKPVRTIEIEN